MTGYPPVCKDNGNKAYVWTYHGPPPDVFGNVWDGDVCVCKDGRYVAFNDEKGLHWEKR